MAKVDKKQIDIPASAASKKLDEDFLIHVMPKEFKGRSADVKKLPVAPKPVPPPAKIMPKPAPVKKVTDLKKKGRRSTLILILVGVIVVLIFLVAALFVLRSLQEETIVEIPVEVPVEEDLVTEPPEELVRQGIDTDSDGLTDVEEEMYGTDFRNPDTDADSFLDGNEVFHRYDPIGYAPSTLLDTGSVEIYESVEEGGYKVYHPRGWRVQESFDPGTGMTSEAEFLSRTGATITISLEERDPSLEDPGDLFETISKEGYTAYTTDNKLTSYLYTEERIYTFVYDLKNEKSIEYLQTFQMMVNSFILP